jgi:cyclic pyranopterin phosphate synthase
MAWSLKAAGLRRVNVSLDTVNPERFAQITRGGDVQRTLLGIYEAQRADLAPIKINSVLQRSTWKLDVPLLLDYATEKHLEIRFIELMRTGTDRAWCESEFVSAAEVSRTLGLDAPVSDTDSPHPARNTLVKWQGAPVKIGWITPSSRPFCSTCDRLRIDAFGQVRRCLMDSQTLDLISLMNRNDERAAVSQFELYLNDKVAPCTMDTSLTMRQIGG